MSKISVCIPIYYKESADTIRQCFRSLEEQTQLPDEVVCALDEPSSPEIENVLDEISKFGKLKIVKCYTPRGSGVGAASNTGINHCHYEYIARMDVDDYAVPERLERECRFLDTHPEVDVVGSNIAEYDTNLEDIIAYRIVPENDEECKKMLKTRDPINHMTAMYRKESIVKAGNYSADMQLCEDTDLWISFYKKGLVFANIPDNLVYVHAGREMYARRGGKRGGKRAYYFVKKSIDYKRSVGLINSYEALFQKVINYCVLVLMNNKMRGFIYEKMLRKKAG